MDTDITQLGGTPAPAMAEVLEGLNDLLQADHDAVGAYDVAIEKLKDRQLAAQVLGYRHDHERHIRELNEAIATLGGTPRNEPHATAPFKLAMQSVAALAGDRGVLMAFRTNELQVRSKYDLYAARANRWPDEVKRLVDRNALDEERHYRWVADALQSLGVGQGEGPELDAATAARERALLGGGMLNEAREKVAEVTGQVRERAAELAGSVRERVSGGAGAVTNRISGLLDTEEGPMAPAARRVRGGVDTGVRGAGEARATLEQRVRERPLQTLLAAGLAGFVIGRLLRK